MRAAGAARGWLRALLVGCCRVGDCRPCSTTLLAFFWHAGALHAIPDLPRVDHQAGSSSSSSRRAGRLVAAGYQLLRLDMDSRQWQLVTCQVCCAGAGGVLFTTFVFGVTLVHYWSCVTSTSPCSALGFCTVSASPACCHSRFCWCVCSFCGHPVTTATDKQQPQHLLVLVLLQGEAPSQRMDSCSVYNPVNQELVVYGGRLVKPPFSLLADVHILRLPEPQGQQQQQPVWQQVQPVRLSSQQQGSSSHQQPPQQHLQGMLPLAGHAGGVVGGSGEVVFVGGYRRNDLKEPQPLLQVMRVVLGRGLVWLRV